ncbi:MAG: hypothetical protein LT080_08755 [Thiobacillus sp.]|nr:hypothetical protein [Thiobacillus sp.]
MNRPRALLVVGIHREERGFGEAVAAGLDRRLIDVLVIPEGLSGRHPRQDQRFYFDTAPPQGWQPGNKVIVPLPQDIAAAEKRMTEATSAPTGTSARSRCNASHLSSPLPPGWAFLGMREPSDVGLWSHGPAFCHPVIRNQNAGKQIVIDNHSHS